MSDDAVAAGEVVLSAHNFSVRYPLAGGRSLQAVSGVSLDLRRGETLGLVGESGCGKSTLARAMVLHPPPTEGRVELDGRIVDAADTSQLRAFRKRVQMIYQDPISSLNPRRTVARIVEEPLKVWKLGDGRARADRVRNLIDAVGLEPDFVLQRRPHEFSGGQCQRISIARALVLQPEILVCDEPVSALDVSVQAAVLNLLRQMRIEHSLSMVFISHDLAVVRNICDRVAVLYLGKLAEVATTVDLFERPRHWYSQSLIAAVPVPDPAIPPVDEPVTGEPPSPIDPPSGCRFRLRCPRSEARCADEEPRLRQVEPDHWVACHFPMSTTDSSVPPTSEELV
jgi:peptide/nickel transport system ATP-binding protein